MPKKKASKSKHKIVQVWKKYKVDGSKTERPPSCPRCGEGTFLAQHKDRATCGRCHFSEISEQSVPSTSNSERSKISEQSVPSKMRTK